MPSYFAIFSRRDPYQTDSNLFVVESPWELEEFARRLKGAFSLGSALYYEKWRCFPEVEAAGPERAWTLLPFHEVVYWAVRALQELGTGVRILPLEVVALEPPTGLFLRPGQIAGIGSWEEAYGSPIPEYPIYQAFRDWMEGQDGEAGTEP